MWKDIKNYEGLYTINENGEIKNSKGELRKINYAKNGYCIIDLYKHNIRKTYFVHRLVAEAFIPNPNNYKLINHIDGDKTNNNIKNLEWCTYSYNIKYGNCPNKRKTKLLNRKDCSKPVEMYSLNGKFLKEFPSLREAGRFIGKENNITDITNCCNGYKINGTPVHKAYGFIWKWKKDI